jgi:ankyrin repeat protein
MHGYNGRGRGHQPVVDLLIARGAPVDLAAAAYLDDPARAAALLATPDGAAQVNAPDPQGLTPLHFAAERGATAVARQLLDAGADPDAVDGDARTPLLCAGHAGPWKAAPALDLVDLLIERGARIDVFLAAALGDVPRLRALLDADPALVRATDAAGHTPLYHAAHNLKLDAVDLLLDRDADVDARAGDGQTPVGTAITHSWDEGGPAVVARLRAAGATLDFTDACIVGDVAHVRALLAADPERLHARRGTESGLHLAARWNRPQVAELLLAAGLDVNLPATDGATPVDAAASWGRTEMVEWLAARGGVPATRPAG